MVVPPVLLGLFLLVVLVDGEARAGGGDGGGDLLLHPVRARVVGVLVGLVFLVHGVGPRGGGTELGELLHVLVVLHLLLAPPVVAGGGLGLLVLDVVVVAHRIISYCIATSWLVRDTVVIELCAGNCVCWLYVGS